MQFLKILLNKWYWWILVRNCCIYVIYNRIINCQFAEFLPILLLILIRIYTICRISSSVQYYGLYVGGQGNTKLINELGMFWEQRLDNTGQEYPDTCWGTTPSVSRATWSRRTTSKSTSWASPTPGSRCVTSPQQGCEHLEANIFWDSFWASNW